jgi:hypothetical protein
MAPFFLSTTASIWPSPLTRMGCIWGRTTCRLPWPVGCWAPSV